MKISSTDTGVLLRRMEYTVALLTPIDFKNLVSCEEDWSSGWWTNWGLSENLHATGFLFDVGQVPFPSFRLSVCGLVLSIQKDKVKIASWPDSRGHLCLDRWNPLSVFQRHCVDLKVHVLQHSREVKFFCKVRTFYFSCKTNMNNHSFPISYYWNRDKPSQRACERPPQIIWV